MKKTVIIYGICLAGLAFLLKTIENCFYCLKESGYLIINIANTNKNKWLVSETIKQSKKAGFELKDKLNLILSSVSGKGEKLEPVLIFKKELTKQPQ